MKVNEKAIKDLEKYVSNVDAITDLEAQISKLQWNQTVLRREIGAEVYAENQEGCFDRTFAVTLKENTCIIRFDEYNIFKSEGIIIYDNAAITEFGAN